MLVALLKESANFSVNRSALHYDKTRVRTNTKQNRSAEEGARNPVSFHTGSFFKLDWHVNTSL